jgi:hypothetical protein
VSEWHTVKRGEFLAQIARDAGFHDPDSIWNAPENSDLRQQRHDPNVLVAGDRVFIPNRTPKDVAAATGQKHSFELASSELKLRLRVLDSGGAPVANQMCEFSVGDLQQLTTDGDGRVERPITLDVNGPRPIDGGLNFFDPQLRLVFHLKVGDLDHEDVVTGQQARLNNLGYFAGSDPPVANPQTDEDRELAQQFRWAVEEFQCDCKNDPKFADLKLKVDGKIDKATPNGANTQKALVRAHGS